MATRLCMTSASRKRFTPFSSMSFVKPRGSKKPSGEMAPGSPKQGSLGLGTQPLMGSTVGTKGDASAGAAFSSVAASTRKAVLDAPVEARGAKAAAEPARAARMTSFILMFRCVWGKVCVIRN